MGPSFYYFGLDKMCLKRFLLQYHPTRLYHSVKRGQIYFPLLAAEMLAVVVERKSADFRKKYLSKGWKQLLHKNCTVQKKGPDRKRLSPFFVASRGGIVRPRRTR